MKPKPEVRVLARQLFDATIRSRIRYGWSVAKWDELHDLEKRIWFTVAREAIKRLGGAK